MQDLPKPPWARVMNINKIEWAVEWKVKDAFLGYRTIVTDEARADELVKEFQRGQRPTMEYMRKVRALIE